ncbi:P protein [Anabrus simplex]|uniref:P protein n=1 Tax=Anabrus simplex TaxID=316456 RepID=UPI0035A2FF8F
MDDPGPSGIRPRFITGNNLESSCESIISPSDLPVAALAAWNDLPELVRNDPYLSPFRRGYEKHIATAPTGTNSGQTTSCPGISSSTSSEDVPAQGENKVMNMLRDFNNSFTENGKFCQQSPKNGALSPVAEETPDLEDGIERTEEKKKGYTWCLWLKVFIIIMVWFGFTLILMLKSEKVINLYQISIPENATRSYWILELPTKNQISLTIQGALLPSYYSNMTTKHLTVWVEVLEYRHHHQLVHNLSSFRESNILAIQNISAYWVVPMVSSKDLIDFVPEITCTKKLDLEFNHTEFESPILRLQLKTNIDASFPLAITYDLSPINTDYGIIYAAGVLVGLYALIVSEVIHRTLAAVVASTISIAILAAMNERPTTAEMISWIDVETLLLLFSMMILVAIFAETGIFDYLAVYAYKITNGRIWPLVNTLCIFTAILSCFLDNVTTVLLMTPVTIRLCEVTELNPVPILIAMTMYSNIGGALTPVGDPPNVIIASNPDIKKAGVNFGTFTLHMGLGVLITMVVIYLYLRCIFRRISDLRFTEAQDVQELRHEIAIWQRAASSLSSYSKDEDIVRHTLMRRVNRLSSDLKQKLNSGSVAIETYRTTLEELQAKYKIRDVPLLVKSTVCLAFVISVFFMHSIPALKLSLGWTALLGAILLLLLAEHEDMEGLLARVEWSTLIFFAALFVLMEALSRLGLIDWIGQQTEYVIMLVPESHRLLASILLILWVSAAASSFVDNIPLTTMMVRIVVSLSQKSDINLPLQPLVWALAFGACLGGNGTLIGSSANVVCAGVAEQHGYRFTFMQYFKIGFPVMILSICVTSVYLLLCHVVFTWH